MTVKLIQAGAARDFAIYRQTPDTTRSETNDIYIGWTNAGCVQMQYRTRHRLAWNGEDVADYGSWSDWSAVPATYTPSVKMADLNAWTTKLPLASTDFTGSNDMMEVQVRVRPCTSSGSSSYDWSDVTVTTLPIWYFPEWAVIAARLDPGTLAIGLEVDPGISRPISSFCINDVWGTDGSEAVPPGKVKVALHKKKYNTFTYLDNGHILLDIPAELANYIPRSNGTDRACISCYMVTGDGAFAYRKRAYTVTVVGGSTKLVEPDPDFTESDTGLAVSVPHSAGGSGLVEYEAITVAYSWKDARGAETAGSIDLVKDDDDWLGEIPSPPFGIEVSYTVTVAGTFSGATVYRQISDTYRTSKTRLYTLTYGTEFFWLGYDLTFNYQTDVDSEIIQLASGRSIARHGKGSKSKISLGGAVVDSTLGVDSKWLPDIGTLHEPHDWILRTPLGERFQVSITDVTRDQQHAHYAALTIQMEEVG